MVSMHLLVLSAFRLFITSYARDITIRVSMHLLVLSAFRPPGENAANNGGYVSMHLLVLSAFRRL